MSTHADAIGSRPTSAAELAEILAADSTPYEIAGFGSKRAIGQPVDAARLDLSALAGIVDYRPSELVLTAKPGTPLDEVRALLAGHGQRLAFEPPSLATLLGAGEAQTLGGIVAANLSGSRRVAAGSARDHCLGVTAVDGRGETFRAGGQVVKNVTGYDLPKLLAGSWGTLAVISELTLKVVPLAETELTLIIADASPAESVARLSAALGSPHEVSGAAFDPWRGSAIRLEGLAASVAARCESLLAEFGNPEAERLDADASRVFWARHAGAGTLADWRVVWRLSVPPADAPRVVEAIGPERYLLDWGGGLIWAAFDQVDSARVRGAIGDGHALLVKAPAGTRTCRQQPPTAALAQVLERVRHAFDPARRLNPGRLD
jgi:glycolate oxidase FAD binding subunit